MDKANNPEEELRARAQAEYDRLKANAERSKTNETADPDRDAPAPGAPAQRATIGSLVASLSTQASSLVRDELEHAQLSLKAKVKNLGIGGVLLAAAAVVAMYGVGLLFVTISFLLAVWLPVWAGFAITTLVLFIVVGILALVGAKKLKASQKYQVSPSQGFSKDVNAFKDGLKK